MDSHTIFNIILVWPIVNVLVLLYKGFLTIHLPYALGFSLIGLTILIRFILYPFTAAQLKASKKMQAVTPHLNKLKEKHKGDAKLLQSETMKLYKEHGINPMAGCLPVLIQLPIIWSLYSVLQHVVASNQMDVLKQVNHIVYFPWLRLTSAWDQQFFGLPLGKTPGDLLAKGWFLILLIPIFTALFQMIQSKMMFAKPEVIEVIEKKGKKKKAIEVIDVTAKVEPKKDDFASAMQSQTLFLLPLMLGFFSFKFAIGLSLYWNTFTIFGIIQQYRIQGLGGLKDWIEKLSPKKN